MKYMLLIYGDERTWAAMSQADMQRIYEGHERYGQELRAAGAYVTGAELQPVATATSVRFTGGKTRTVDGPFAETKEQLAGYYLIDVENLEQALAWAEKMPGMTDGTVEVRPLGMGE